MEKHICLKFLRDGHYDYPGMHIPENIEISGLLKIIEVKELIECLHSNGHINHKEPYVNSGELEDRKAYEVHTENFERTLELIIKYNYRH